MIEKIYNYSTEGKAIVEKTLDVKDVSIAHAVVEKGESFPRHTANADVNIILVHGELSAKFDRQEKHTYTKGDIVRVPMGTEMELLNSGDDNLEFFAIKAPSPTFK